MTAKLEDPAVVESTLGNVVEETSMLPGAAELREFWADSNAMAALETNGLSRPLEFPSTAAGPCLDDDELEQAVWYRMMGTAAGDPRFPPLEESRRQHLGNCEYCGGMVNAAMPSKSRCDAIAADLAAMAPAVSKGAATVADRKAAERPVREPILQPAATFASGIARWLAPGFCMALGVVSMIAAFGKSTSQVFMRQSDQLSFPIEDGGIVKIDNRKEFPSPVLPTATPAQLAKAAKTYERLAESKTLSPADREKLQALSEAVSATSKNQKILEDALPVLRAERQRNPQSNQALDSLIRELSSRPKFIAELPKSEKSPAKDKSG